MAIIKRDPSATLQNIGQHKYWTLCFSTLWSPLGQVYDVCACVRVFVRACVRACVCACVRAFMRACLRECVHACMCAYVCSCVHACAQACVTVCFCVRVCLCVCIQDKIQYWRRCCWTQPTLQISCACVPRQRLRGCIRIDMLLHACTHAYATANVIWIRVHKKMFTYGRSKSLPKASNHTYPSRHHHNTVIYDIFIRLVGSIK